MIAISFQFPAGRYHATPWGHQVNEGLVEWPPCPWRLARALIAAGYSRKGWPVVPPAAQSLLEKLSAVLPEYALPEVSIAHSRHYMPVNGGKTTLVLDTWLNVTGELVVCWPVELTPEERSLLAYLVENLSYLGRSESWVVSCVTDRDKNEVTPSCFPHQRAAGTVTENVELIDLLAPVPSPEYAAWRAQQVPEHSPGKLTAKQKKDHHQGKRPEGGRGQALRDLPSDAHG